MTHMHHNEIVCLQDRLLLFRPLQRSATTITCVLRVFINEQNKQRRNWIRLNLQYEIVLNWTVPWRTAETGI